MRDEGAGDAGRRVDRPLQRLLARLLQVEVQRQAHRAPGHRLVGGGRPLRSPERVDGDAGGAVDAAQEAVVGALEALLADDRALHDPAEALELELLGADLGDRADELGGQLALGVAAQVGLVDVDAGEGGLALEQVVADRLRHVGAHGDARVGHERQRAHDALLDRLRAHAEHARPAGAGAPPAPGWAAAGIATTSPRLPSRSLRACRHRLAPSAARSRSAWGRRSGRAARRSPPCCRRACGPGGRRSRRAAPARARGARGCRRPGAGSRRPTAPAGTTGGRR